MFVMISCPKCGNNSRFIFENPSSFKNFTFCEYCGGFAFAVNHHNIDKRNHLFAKRIGVYSSEWPETMASLLCRPDKPSDLTTNNATEIYLQPLTKEF